MILHFCFASEQVYEIHKGAYTPLCISLLLLYLFSLISWYIAKLIAASKILEPNSTTTVMPMLTFS